MNSLLPDKVLVTYSRYKGEILENSNFVQSFHFRFVGKTRRLITLCALNNSDSRTMNLFTISAF